MPCSPPRAHLVVRPCPKSRLRDGGEWGRKDRLKAGSGLCELGSSSRWPPWRRCFCVWQDGGDALLLALKCIGAVELEAGVLMESIIVRAAASRRHLHHRLGSRSWWTSWARSSPCLGQQCRTAPGVLVWSMGFCADVPASAVNGGSWALGASHACMCSWPAVLPGCVLCSCSRCACLCTHLWGGKRSFAREEQICVCPVQTLHRGLSGHQKRHCSGAFRSHDMIYGLSEA